MSKRPSTHEEWVDAVRAVVERLRGDAELRDADGRTLAAAVIRDDITIISALLPPLPEPIKVGDRVRHIPSGDMEATVTDLGTERAIFVQLDDGQDDVWLTKHTERVAPAPSDTEQPEPVECSDPEALAAAVAAGQVVEGMTPGGGSLLVREGAWGAVDQWRNWLSRPGNRARIWPSGSTPGGAS